MLNLKPTHQKKDTMHPYSKAAVFSFISCLATNATAQTIDFTKPVPTLAQSQAAAKTAGKPLVVEFSATWCEPCKNTSRDLRLPAGRAALDKINLVVYEGDDGGIGEDLMQKLGISAFPTMVAFDTSGKEIARRSGYVPLPALVNWFAELHERGIPLDDFMKLANSDGKNAGRQLLVGKRLVEAGRGDEAVKYFSRATKTGDSAIKASATWYSVRVGYTKHRKELATGVVTHYLEHFIGFDESDEAIKMLALAPKPPSALISRAIDSRISKWNDSVANDMVYVALRAGAYEAAQKLADKLPSDKPNYLDTKAEVSHMRGQTDKAITLSEKAVSEADAGSAESMKANLERFRRGKKEPSREQLMMRTPSIELERTAVLPVPPKPPVWVKAEREIAKLAKEQCAGLAPVSDFYGFVTPGSQASENTVTARAGTPVALTDCVEKVVKTVTIGRSTIFWVWVEMLSKDYKEKIDELTKSVRECVPGKEIEAVLLSEPNRKPRVVYPNGTDSQIMACVDKAVAALPPVKSALFRSVTFGAE